MIRRQKLDPIFIIHLYGLMAESHTIMQNIERFFREKKIKDDKASIINYPAATCLNLQGSSVAVIVVITNMKDFQKKFGREFQAIINDNSVKVKLITAKISDLRSLKSKAGR
jgi:spore germination protein YaaH